MVTCRECGGPFERPDGGLQGVYLRILEKIRICPDCCEIAEAEAEVEREEREQTERAERMRRRQAACGIPELLRGLTWDRVASARPEAVDAAQRWSRGELRGLFLAGPVGVGKTWLAAAAAWARLEHGPLRWFSAPVLLAHLSLGFENELHDRALLTLSDATTGALVLDDIDKTRRRVAARGPRQATREVRLVSVAGVKERATYELPRLALSIEEACGALGISWDLWHEHVAPEVRTVRLGRRRLVPIAELQKWLAERAELALDDED